MAAGCVVASGLLVVGSGVGLAIIPLTAPGLFLTGLGVSTWDVAMNVEATDVERAVGRTLMPRFHAGFSMGTVVGALVGAGFAGLGLSLTSQLVATSLLVVTLVIVGTQQFLPPIADDPGEQGAAPARIFWMWREPRTLTIGLVVLAFAFTEGSANDWMAVALVSGHGTTDAVGALGFGVFLAAMTLARFLGGTVLDRYGRVVVLRCSAGVAIVGLLVVGLAGPTWLVFPGALLWGVGAALGFPTGMSAAGDDPQRAAMRVSVVSSIGYTAFLAGPPLIGFLADHVGILRALLVVLVALVLALATSHSTRTTSVPSPRS